MIDIKQTAGRYLQAAVGMLGVGAAGAVATSPDRTAQIVGAVAAFFAWLAHRTLAMKDVERVVTRAIDAAVPAALAKHENECKWVIGRRTQHSQPFEAGSHPNRRKDDPQ